MVTRKTNRGAPIDFDALMAQQSPSDPALGNMGVNAKGDKLGKMSLFEKEITNLTDYLELLENNELSLLLVDEIMSGPNFNESTKISYAICKNLNKFKNNISLITTHNNKITKLEKNNRSVNYKMVIDKNDTNIYTYKLVKGISNDFLGMDILKSKMNI